MTVRSTILSLAALVCLSTNTAIAEETRSRAIQIADYDLTSVEDVDRLHREIVSQTRIACRHLYKDAHRYMTHDKIDACVQEAVDETISSAGIPQLSRVHATIRPAERYRRDRSDLSTVQLASPAKTRD